MSLSVWPWCPLWRAVELTTTAPWRAPAALSERCVARRSLRREWRATEAILAPAFASARPAVDVTGPRPSMREGPFNPVALRRAGVTDQPRSSSSSWKPPNSRPGRRGGSRGSSGSGAGLVGASQRGVIARRDVRLHVRTVDRLVRELADQVSGVPAAQFPARVGGKPLDLGVQPLARDVRVALEEASPGREPRAESSRSRCLTGSSPRTKVRPKSASYSSKMGPKSANTMSSAPITRSGGFSR